MALCANNLPGAHAPSQVLCGQQGPDRAVHRPAALYLILAFWEGSEHLVLVLGEVP